MIANIWRLAALGTALTLAVSAATPLADTQARQAGGLKIFYREAGFPARPAIVLWHGYPSALHPLRNPILIGAEYLVPYRNGRNPASEKRARELLTCGFTKLPYSNGFRNPDKVSPDAYTLAQMNSDRPGNQDIQHALLYDYLTNARKDPRWHQALRRVKPPALAAWGKSDPIFIPPGAGPFKTHAPKAEHPFLNTGHVALEEDLDQIASLFWPRAFASGPPRRKTTCNESRP